MDDEQPGRMLTVAQFAEQLAVSRTVAYQLISRGEVPAIRVGGTVRVPERWLVAREREALSAARASESAA